MPDSSSIRSSGFDQEGVTLTTATGVHAVVAEAAFGLLLALTRHIADAVNDAKTHTWVEREGPEIAGSTIAIIGLGTIGEAFARRAQGWEVELIGYKRDPDSYTGIVDRVYGPDSLLDVCAMADTIVLTLPGATDTNHLIGAAELEALGAGFLINVGRGSVVDEQALIAALTTGELRGAGLDVFEVEPLPIDSQLWDMPNVVITPHTAGATPRYGERLAKIFRQNLAAFQGDDTPWVNPRRRRDPPRRRLSRRDGSSRRLEPGGRARGARRHRHRSGQRRRESHSSCFGGGRRQGRRRGPQRARRQLDGLRALRARPSRGIWL